MAIRITCIKKSGGYHDAPPHAISDLGWVNDQTNETGTSSRLQVYDWIKNKNGVCLRPRFARQPGPRWYS